MSIFFTSDLHFGHANICEFAGRPFPWGPDGVEEMNEAIIERWNESVHRYDMVFILGDFAMGWIHETLPLAQRLNGRLVLICGNHDRPWQGASKKQEKLLAWRQKYWDAGFVQILHSLERPSTSRAPYQWSGLNLHHFPYEGDSGDHEDRHTAFRPLFSDEWLLHGHVHDAWRQRDRQINVGIDAWGGRLVTLDEVYELIDAGPQFLPAIGW